jgi:AcrR family transcriptional regulator
MTHEPRARRTNAERAAETVDLIVNATLDAISDVGVRNATTGEISRRAGVSIGALFHHFDTRLDLIVAAIEYNLADRYHRVAAFAERVWNQDILTSDHPRALLKLIRAITREPRSMVWLEVLTAARTDPELRARVTPLLARQRDLFRSVALTHPTLATMPEADRMTWVELLRNIVNGESVWSIVMPHHDVDEAKIDALLALAGAMGAARPHDP